jgi:glycosyltransferase involved in cell wall biosynthesis
MRPEDSTAYDVSLIITAHREGRLAHGSVRSAQRAMRFAEQQGIQVELIVVLCAPSDHTLRYFEQHEQPFDQIHRTEVRDTGLARNQGAAVARGRYLTFLEAGDLLSENWLAAAFKLAVTDGRFVLHPEQSLHFGRELLLVTHTDSTSPDYSPLNLIKCDYWASLSFMSKDFFLSGNRFIAADESNGFGHAGWHWNCETIAHGAIHRIVPETLLFKRQKSEGSSVEGQGHGRPVMPPTKLFDCAPESSAHDSQTTQTNFESDARAQHSRARRPFLAVPYRGLRKIGVKLVGGRPRLSRFCAEVVSATKRLASPAPTTAQQEPLPAWLLAEWRHIHEIEPELFPSKELTDGLARDACRKSEITLRYPELSALAGPAPTHIFLVPWLKYGGADFGALYFMRAVVEENPAHRVVCIITENTDSPLAAKLPREVSRIELGKLLAGFSEDEQAMLLGRLLVQKRPRVIHNIQSRLGYEVLSAQGLALATLSSLFVSIFCEDISPEGRTLGYAFDYLPRIMDYLSGVFTDTERFVNKLCELYGFEKSRFSTLYFPVLNPPQEKESGSRRGTLDVLWAGRIDRQKRPDVLIQMASELAGLPIHFHVYGEPSLDPNGFKQFERLKQLPNVTTYGNFDGFESIPATNYDLFLFTSGWEGIPIVILQAITSGLPVIAPDVGGIKEVINESTGFLVSRPEAVDEYVAYLKGMLDNPEPASRKVSAARTLVETRHSWQAFVSRLRQVPQYFDSEGALTTTHPGAGQRVRPV